MQSTYSADFYADQQGGSYRTAQRVLPWLQKFLAARSVLDVGCGVGTWLKVFKEMGVDDVLGVDGDYVGAEQLQIPSSQFSAHDLGKPLDLNRRFDLAMSLEVAEHLPPQSAEGFIRSICAHAPVVLFSAAIPEQGGTNHVNEQWPAYWIGLFAECSFVCHDCIRPFFWNDERVEFWYAQNMMLFCQPTSPVATSIALLPSFGGAPLVNPREWATRTGPRVVSWSQIARDVRERLKRVLQPQGG